jgi:GNAT superfamily N-acetyltransferase
VETVTIRRATLADVPVLAETVAEGFASYRAFAPPGWTPPPEPIERTHIEERLPLPDAWCRLAYDGRAPAGHVALLAATERTPDRRAIPGLAHLWMLFIREPWRGTGLAPRLLALAVEEAAARGCGAMRLHTPAAHGRARAFYEREGWTTDGVATPEPMLGLDLVEYRRPL